MSDETQNVVLQHLRHIRGKVDRLDENVLTMALRVDSVERILARQSMTDANQNADLHDLKARVERIERHLELPEAR